MAMDTIRAFVALALNDDLRNALRQTERQLKDGDRAGIVRWVAPENIHLTLKFLANVDVLRVPALRNALENISRDFAPFALEARGLGCFPNAHRPNNLWVGLSGDVARAEELAKKIDDAFAAEGIPREARRFAPHLTLGRIRREARPADRAAIGALVEKYSGRGGVTPPLLGTIKVDAVYLIQSDLRPSGPVYTELAKVELGQV